MNILVLGGGMVGSAIARDLAADKHFTVTVADRSESALQRCAAQGRTALSCASLVQPFC